MMMTTMSKDSKTEHNSADQKENYNSNNNNLVTDSMGNPVLSPMLMPWWVKYFDFFPHGHNGVPFFCKNKYCPLDHRNKLTNQNNCVRKIGPIGFEYFDLRRKIYFGLASLVTIFAMVITIWGCSALSTERSIVQRTYWYGGTGVNTTSNTDFSFYVGLRSLEYVNCDFVPGYDQYPSNCNRQSFIYFSSSCSEGPAAAACSACANVAYTMWATAFMACVSLILSLLGAQTRMHSYADVPAQKMLGMFSEAWNFVTLLAALFTFHSECRLHLLQAFNQADLSTDMWSGPGLYCYAVCAASAFVRASVHWLTPLPGQGKRGDVCGYYSSWFAGIGAGVNSETKTKANAQSLSWPLRLSITATNVTDATDSSGPLASKVVGNNDSKVHNDNNVKFENSSTI